MVTRKEKVTSLKEAVALIPDGCRLAIGGHTFRRHPMALIYEIIRQRKKNLTLLGWNNANDFDILIGCGLVKQVETAYVGMSMFGLAPHFRQACQEGRLAVLEHSETTAIDMFRASAIGLAFFPSKAPLGSDLMRYNNRIIPMADPFTGEQYAAIKASDAQVAIIHAHMADVYGNVLLDQRRLMEGELDAIIGKAAKMVIVSVEQIVSNEFVRANAHLTVLPSPVVTAVVETPYGAHPTACDTRYDYDLEHIQTYLDACKTQDAWQQYLTQYVTGVSDHMEYLEKIGIRRLNELTRRGGGLG